MSIVEEFNEMCRTFFKLGFLGKLLIAISMFTAASSIASLSENLIKWKGFFLDALIIYEHFFVGSIRTFGTKIGMEFTTAEIHAAVLASISVSIGMHLLVVGQTIAFEEINKKYGGNQSPNLTIYRILSIGFPITMFVWLGYNSMPSNPLITGLVFAFYPFFIVAPKFLLCKFFPERFVYYEKGRFSYLKSYYSLVIVLFLIVGALGAINNAFFK